MIILDFQTNGTATAAERTHGLDSGSGRAVECLLLFHQGTSRTQGNAGAAEGAFRLLQRHIVYCCWLGSKAPANVINGALNNQLMVCPNAFGAEDTLGEVSLNEWVDLFNHTGLRNPLKFYQSYAQLGGYLSQLAAVALVANKAGVRVAGKHELDNHPAALYYPR